MPLAQTVRRAQSMPQARATAGWEASSGGGETGVGEEGEGAPPVFYPIVRITQSICDVPQAGRGGNCINLGNEAQHK